MILRRLPTKRADAGFLPQVQEELYPLDVDAAAAPTAQGAGESANERQLQQLQGSTFFKRISLRTRLATLTALIVIAAIAIITLAAYSTVSQTMSHDIDRKLQTQAQLIATDELIQDRLEQRMYVEGSYQPQFTTTGVGIQALIVPLQETGRNLNEELLQGFVDPSAFAVMRGSSPYTFSDNGNDRLYTLRANSGAVVVVSESTESMQRTLDSLALVLFLLAVTGSVGALVTSLAVASAGVQPINRLRRAVDRVTATGELRQIPIHSADELGSLTMSFNGMMNALQQAETKQKNLVADASHELKTPLTSMRTNVELLMQLSKPGAPVIDPAEVRALERDVIAQIDEMSSLIGDLVDLAREDGGTADAQLEEIHIGEVLNEALDRVQRRRNDVTFEMHLIDWEIEGERFTLSRALLNLLDNAAKWSPENGVVRVWMEPIHSSTAGAKHSAPNTVEIRIADSGPGIPAEDRDKVFDRFYRSIQARSMPGSGLGLAIVQQVIERHCGSVRADESDDGGALMRVLLPGRLAEASDVEHEHRDGRSAHSHRSQEIPKDFPND